jgi:hypothetical protein
VVERFGELLTFQEAHNIDPPQVLVPGDRDCAWAIFSGVQENLFLLGGHRLTGEPTGEIWQYDVHADAWTHLFHPEGPSQPRLGDVLASAFNEPAQEILVLDRVTLPGGRGGSSALRLSVFDLAAETLRVVRTFEHADDNDVFGLTATDGGGFLLVRERQGSNRWSTRRFRLTARGNIRCGPESNGVGVVFDVPIHATSGVFLPVMNNGVQMFEAVTSSGDGDNDNDDNGYEDQDCKLL